MALLEEAVLLEAGSDLYPLACCLRRVSALLLWTFISLEP